MVGKLVKWIHDEIPTNLGVIIDDLGLKEDHIILSEEETNEMLFLCYDFVTNEQFYALESELSFIN